MLKTLCLNIVKMAPYLCLLFLLISSATACDRCVHQSKASHFSSDKVLLSGACGYGSLASSFSTRLAAASPSLYNDGAGCGACFQMRCKNTTMCTEKGVTVVVTDKLSNNQTDFVLNNRGFRAMARDGFARDILRLKTVDIEYKRVPCNYRNKNLAIRVDESSKKPDFLAITFLYLGGQTEILFVDVARVGGGSQTYMSRNSSAVWYTDRAPAGALQFRIGMRSGYDMIRPLTDEVLPADWVIGEIYDTGLKITDIAQEMCSPCDDTTWGDDTTLSSM